jgi:3-dehydroquinate dehydratase type I
MICAVIANKTYDQCRRILRYAECAELRLDLLDLTRTQLKKLMSQPVKIVATCREGKYSDDDRMDLMETAIHSGAAYIDIELEMNTRMKKSLIKLARDNRCKVIISHHNFTLTPPFNELRSIINKCRDSGGDIVKIACQIKNADDVANILSLYTFEKNIIAFGMGLDGLITRIAAPLLGAEFTYASVDKDNKTAPGQVTVKEMKALYRILGYES